MWRHALEPGLQLLVPGSRSWPAWCKMWGNCKYWQQALSLSVHCLEGLSNTLLQWILTLQAGTMPLLKLVCSTHRHP